ncbi:4-hydroxy-tetrahydrodipicolinate reductase [Haloplanus halophilus]|uniref:4-hydroxy-tetrahydrodipicolinate reductase n=1 Tax=Haloplanus halophilus TaxID=2949993 RepID=UPI00273A67CD|nr:4-hydroxy-tetrahydrodipicolinate reductase [Haloplanus sp. GDY1]
MIEVAVTGAGGHMGREVLAAATDREGMDVTLAVNRTAVGPVEGIEIEDEADLPRLLDERDPDVLVDFTVPDPSARYVEACADAGVAAVVGTTGFSESQLAVIADAAEAVPVLRAANFARGVAALRRAIREAVAAVPDYDAELTETHHNRKRDAPSGTALTILDDVDRTRDGTADRVHGREGEQPREEGEVGVHARRAGDVTGEHELLLAGNHEVLTLTHRAESRGVFAEGALDAADWLVGRPAGEYDFEDVL